MSKKSDDSIDRIFRQALTQYDTKFHEDDWLKMEKLLNEEAERKAAARSRRIKGTAYTLTGLTGLFIAVYFLAIKNPSGSIADSRDSVTEMQASEALTENGNVKLENPSEGLLSQSAPKAPGATIEPEINVDDTNVSKNQSSQSKAIAKEPDAGPIRPGDQSSTHQRGRNEENAKNKSELTTSSNGHDPRANDHIQRNPSVSFEDKEDDVVKPGLDPSNKSNPSLTQPEEAVNVEAVDDKRFKSDSASGHTYLKANSGESGKGTLMNNDVAGINTSDQVKKLSAGMVAENGIPASSDSSSVPEVKSQTMVTDSSVLEDVLASEEKKTKLRGRLSVAFLIAPEFSTTSLSDYSSPGGSYGLRIGYQLTNRLSVQTGLIRSHKKYEGSGYDYEPRNPAYWQVRTNGVVPEEIYSKCLVYELPIGIQFDAIQTSRSRLFVSAAASSYFMISQAYDYNFQSPNPGADTGWRSKGSESYWFSVGMVSAGYERYITRSFAIGIEPYLKVSLAEIGWPKIKLYSTGAYVTLRYRFMNREKF